MKPTSDRLMFFLMASGTFTYCHHSLLARWSRVCLRDETSTQGPNEVLSSLQVSQRTALVAQQAGVVQAKPTSHTGVLHLEVLGPAIQRKQRPKQRQEAGQDRAESSSKNSHHPLPTVWSSTYCSVCTICLFKPLTSSITLRMPASCDVVG